VRRLIAAIARSIRSCAAGFAEWTSRTRGGCARPSATSRSIEALLGRRAKLNVLAALALFDDADRAGDVMTRINNRYGKRHGDVFQAANRGAHHGADGDLRNLVRDAAILAREFTTLP
jgi:hypothetical protein